MFFGESDNGKFTAPPDFDGPTKDRHCTDIVCFALIVVMWIAMTGVGIYAVQNGDYRLVLFPLDYDGNICGTDFAMDMTEYPNLLYINAFTGGVCVKDCPNLSNQTEDGLTDIRTLVTYNGTWQPLNGSDSELAINFVQVGDYSKSNDSIACTDETCYPNNLPNMSWLSPGISKGYSYAYYVGSTYELLFRCYLTSEADQKILELVDANRTESQTGSSISNSVNEAYDFWNKLFADCYIARWYILGFGFGVSLIVSLCYIALMRFPGLLTTVIWTSILVTIALFFIGGNYTYNQAITWDNAEPQTVDDTTIRGTKIFGIICYSIGGFCVLMACCLRKAIMEAIVCTKEAGKAVNSMTIILLVPIAQSIGFFLFFVPFMWYCINLASMATITTVDIPLDTVGGAEIAIRTFEFDDDIEYLGWVRTK
jgi:solute carrier family 44 (choline transporter-like protein), member 2/4/5